MPTLDVGRQLVPPGRVEVGAPARPGQARQAHVRLGPRVPAVQVGACAAHSGSTLTTKYYFLLG